jgi:uncharacterized cofD-like protein
MKKVVTIGGGTGNFVVLSGLRNYNVELSAVVSMADDGGSTGILRDELGVLPPGDVRQCLVALSDSSQLMRNMMNYRFEGGGLDGHSFGNILLSTLEKVTGSFEKAVEEVGKILTIKGKVLPVTTHQVRLKMILKNGKILDGEGKIFQSEEIDQGYTSLFLEPSPTADRHAIDEIMNADLIVLGPGGLYTSIIPNLLVEGISKALRDSTAKKVFVMNLMNKKGQTTKYKASDHLAEIKKFIGADIFDYVLVNGARPAKELIDIYAGEGTMVENDLVEKVVVADLLDPKKSEYAKSDSLARHRALIRHDSNKLAAELMKIVK